jgi:hypothetical protein
MKTFTSLAIACTLAISTSLATATAPQWTWEAGTQTNNGAITLKSTTGSTTYSGTQNPTGAVAKTNQTAVTQPPTVIIQATSGGSPFNYKDDCWIFDLVGHANQRFIGAGKVNTTAKTFTGIFGHVQHATSPNAAVIVSALPGSSHSQTHSVFWCGSDATCAWNPGGFISGSPVTTGNQTVVVAAANLPILTYRMCYQ